MTSLLAFIPIANRLIIESRASGFTRFLKLAFSDTRLVLGNWQDYILSLLESFPIMPVVGLLSAAAIALLCAKIIIKYFSALTLARHLKIVNK